MALKGGASGRAVRAKRRSVQPPAVHFRALGKFCPGCCKTPSGDGVNRRNEVAQDELIASSMGNRQVRSVFKWLLLRTSTTILDCHLFKAYLKHRCWCSLSFSDFVAGVFDRSLSRRLFFGLTYKLTTCLPCMKADVRLFTTGACFGIARSHKSRLKSGSECTKPPRTVHSLKIQVCAFVSELRPVSKRRTMLL